MVMNRLPVDVPGTEDEFRRVEVRRSVRRKKTISAEIVGDALVVSIPQRLSRAEEQEWVSVMAQRMAERRKRERLNSEGALERKAAELAGRYGLPVPRTIEWAPAQQSRWGVCIYDERAIKLSVTLADYPAWVRDYVIVHELAHLAVPDHSAEFWQLVARYPLTERSRGFLIAKGMEEG
jgi:predicted metal-dependent hydrolase